MRAWWQMWRSHFKPQTCEGWIERARTIPAQDGVVGHGGKARPDPMRVSTIRWIHRRDEWTPLLDRIVEMFHEANNNAFGFDLRHLTSLQFTEYHAEQAGHYSWHEDLSWRSEVEYHRKLSVVVQLSPPDSYEGGELQLKEEPPDPAELRQQGTVIIFPSFLQHRVTPVTRGTRYSLVGWMNGPKFR